MTAHKHHDTDETGLPARRAALRLLEGVRRDRRPLADLLAEPEGPLAGLPAADAARAQRLATVALRESGRIEAVLDPRLRKPPPLKLRLILELAVAELCALEGAPHGVVNDAVALVRQTRKAAHLSGLANAVLRRVAEEDVPRWAELPPTRLPGWLAKHVRNAWGQEAVTAVEAAHAAPPPLDLTPRDGDAAALAERLNGAALPSGSVRLTAPGQVSALPGYETGDWWVQDAAAAIPARVLNAQAGEHVLDLCAAPGGKTLQMAAAGAEVTALDISGPRLKRLAANLARTGLKADTVTADALHWEPSAPFDAILLDAPCSATGTIRRHPDLPHVKRPEDVDALTELQAALLTRALGWLAPGGRLVFCTCSLLTAEGEAQVAACDADADPLDPAAYGLPAEAAAAQGLRLRPDFWADRGGMDGFFIARLRRG